MSLVYRKKRGLAIT